MAMEATRTILVIEDDAILRKLLDEVLSTAGYRVVQAADARYGLSLAAAERPALILSDCVLPDGPGADVLDLLLAQVAHLADGLPWTPPAPALAEPARSNAAGRMG
jgi:two-component system, cell cycle response regulator DivK